MRRKRVKVFGVKQFLVLLGLFSILIGSLYYVFEQEIQTFVNNLPFEESRFVANFDDKSMVQIHGQAERTDSGEDLTHYRNWIGKVVKVTFKRSKSGESYYVYDIIFDKKRGVTKVKESNLIVAPKSLYSKKDIVQIQPQAGETTDGVSLASDYGKLAKIVQVKLNYSSTHGGYQYDVLIDDEKLIKNVPESNFKTVYSVPLLESNTAMENNIIIKNAFTYAKEHPGTTLAFPQGLYRIGSKTGDVESALLPSDTSIIGQKTILIVEGAVHWFALATGSGAADGVKNFTMRDIHVIASDLKNGNQFLIMANHGDNWHIADNSFIMVHKRDSHVFDMGALQNSTFDNNRFIGYAPEIKNNPDDQHYTSHAFYSEAIQLDATDASGIWDGGLIENIDPNYSLYNSVRHYAHNITISNNQFLPYIDENGETIAYSASIGQHSSGVGMVVIKGNLFVSSILTVYQYKNTKPETSWLWEPIHFVPGSTSPILLDNIIQ